jgi:hypothetical protein
MPINAPLRPDAIDDISVILDRLLDGQLNFLISIFAPTEIFVDFENRLLMLSQQFFSFRSLAM